MSLLKPELGNTIPALVRVLFVIRLNTRLTLPLCVREPYAGRGPENVFEDPTLGPVKPGISYVNHPKAGRGPESLS